MIKLTTMNQFKKLPKDDRDTIIEDWYIKVLDCYSNEKVDRTWAMDWIANDLEDGGICKIKYRPHDHHQDYTEEKWICGRELVEDYWQQRLVN
tara:strand:- start:177 stop:455 length:279 start_codon:yes stop_codon:yes gene_type:complete